jgi:hypothetical protein
MPYCQLFYHLVWTSENRQPVIDARLESRLHRYMQKTALNVGAIVYAVSGTTDHVHMVERTSDPGSEVREPAIPYGYGDDEWRRELKAWDDKNASG